MKILDIRNSSEDEWVKDIPIFYPSEIYVYVIHFDDSFMEIVEISPPCFLGRNNDLKQFLSGFKNNFRIVVSKCELREGLFDINIKKLLGNGMKLEDLFEIQIRRKMTNFNLDNPIRNKEAVSALIQRGSAISVPGREFSKGIEMYHASKNELGTPFHYFGLIDTVAEKVIYLMAYSTDPIHGCFIQNILWRTKNNHYKSDTEGLAEDIFFKILLERNKKLCVKSDDIQTSKGRSSWIDRIGKAWKKGFFVYYFDGDRLIQIRNLDDLHKIQNKAWGYGNPIEDEMPNKDTHPAAFKAMQRQKFSKKKESRMGRVQERTLIISKKPMS